MLVATQQERAPEMPLEVLLDPSKELFGAVEPDSLRKSRRLERLSVAVVPLRCSCLGVLVGRRSLLWLGTTNR